ncbi:MAG TPA: BlaI/MecI/CopY family transcriptional regulator [Mycobacterium sp.]
MGNKSRLGNLERAIMDQLWSRPQPQTGRDVHAVLSAHRPIAYTTVMTVLNRLTRKDLVVQYRDNRAHRFAARCGRDVMVASLLADALDQVRDIGDRQAALVYFVEHVGADEAAALRRALAELECERAH